MEFSYHDRTTGRYGMLGNLYFICNTKNGLLYTNTYGLYRLNNAGELWLLDEDGENKKFCFIPDDAEGILSAYKNSRICHPNFFQLDCYKKEWASLSMGMINTMLNIK